MIVNGIICISHHNRWFGHAWNICTLANQSSYRIVKIENHIVRILILSDSRQHTATQPSTTPLLLIAHIHISPKATDVAIALYCWCPHICLTKEQFYTLHSSGARSMIQIKNHRILGWVIVSAWLPLRDLWFETPSRAATNIGDIIYLCCVAKRCNADFCRYTYGTYYAMIMMVVVVITSLSKLWAAACVVSWSRDTNTLCALCYHNTYLAVMILHRGLFGRAPNIVVAMCVGSWIVFHFLVQNMHFCWSQEFLDRITSSV